MVKKVKLKGKLKGGVRLDCLKPTKGEWWPSWELTEGVPTRGEIDATRSLVKVSLIRFSNNGGYRVCAWGSDDYGLDRDFLRNDRYDEAFELYSKIQRALTDFCNHADNLEVADLISESEAGFADLADCVVKGAVFGVGVYDTQDAHADMAKRVQRIMRLVPCNNLVVQDVS